MVSPLFLGHLLVLASVVILIGEVYAVYFIHRLRRELDGEDGVHLLTIVYRFGIGVLVAQALTVINAFLRVADDGGAHSDIRLLLFVLIQVLFAAMLTWTVVEVHRIPRR